MALTLARVGDAFEVFHAEQFGDGYIRMLAQMSLDARTAPMRL